MLLIAQLSDMHAMQQEKSGVAELVQGGSQEGYARWEAFRQKGLDLYAAHRNNALKRCKLRSNVKVEKSLCTWILRSQGALYSSE